MDGDTSHGAVKLLAALVDGRERSIVLRPGGVARVGRESTADLCVPHASVSRTHLEVKWDGALLVRDPGSRNGTRMAGERLPVGAWRPWPAGTVLRLGGVDLFVRTVPRRSLERAAEDDASAQPPLGVLCGPVQLLAADDVSVLLVGETGVGKEIVAEAIHRRSRRAAKPFVKVNCAAVAATLFESEFFGHTQGAFTHAVSARRGYFEEAEGGTILLDEIGELPMDMQAKLLRVLEERRVRPVGANADRSVNVRLIAATNRDLCQEALAGRFRKDLYYRLAAFELKIPVGSGKSEWSVPEIVTPWGVSES